ncbi:MAG: tripartite tricarboxylate transporter substrate binding protein [Pseudomonadota bacterium]
MTSAHKRATLLATAALALGLPLLAPGALAQAAYPSRPITLVVPNTAGGGMDSMGRAVSAKMGQLMNTSFIVDNKPGANGNIGGLQVAKAAPDGYTLLLGQTAQFAINPHMYTNMPYDPLKDLIPVALLADAPNVVVVGFESPFHTLADIVKAAKTSKDKLDLATPGSGTPSHLIGEMFQQAAGVKFVHVPYKGAPSAITDTIAGRTALMMSSVPSALAQIKGGKLRAVAISAAKRSPSLPDVPTIAEQGYPGFDAGTWYGLFLPAGTPPAIVQKLNAVANEALKSQDVIDRVRTEGGDTIGGTSAALAAKIRKDYAQLGKAVKDSGAKVE